VIRGTIATIALFAATASVASAQWYPGQQNYGYGNQQQAQTQGVVTSYNWYDLHVQAPNGRDQFIRLHQGTIINPRGTTLQNGMPVHVIGYIDRNGQFQANEVDVANNGCNRGRGGYNSNGQYGSGYYNGNGNGNGNGSYGGACKGHGHNRGQGGDGDDNNDQNGPPHQ